MSTCKERLDVLMVKKGLAETREKARYAIINGAVRVANVKIDKPGTLVAEERIITVNDLALAYVSRGGIKLEKAIKEFDIQVVQKVFIDIGASTGGFTDCLLKHGARKVYAVDVGYGQLAWKLRQDQRVVVMERTNIRNVTCEKFCDTIEGATIDVSFISLRLVLPMVRMLIAEGSDIIALVKPQFEAGKGKVGKGGVVRQPDVHAEVLADILRFVRGMGLYVQGLSHSPITGPKGNIEFLLHARNVLGATQNLITDDEIEHVVERAHAELINAAGRRI